MELSSRCPENDVACFAGELLRRWEHPDPTGAMDDSDEAATTANRDCLLCLLDDLDPGFDD